MQLSWSHKLFFLANNSLGRSARFDWLVKFCAEKAIIFMFVFLLITIGMTAAWQWVTFWQLVVQFSFAAAAAFALSWLFGWLYPHRRPVIEFPEAREIIKPLSHWKSLPSDHAIATALVAYFVLFSLESRMEVVVVYFAAAALVSVARVFAGVHYPRDIVAGWVLATAVAFIFWY